MAFDQISIPNDPRPLNVARTLTEESRIAAVSTTGLNGEGFFPTPVCEPGSPRSVPVFYPATVSDAGFVGLMYGNPGPGVTAWRPRGPAPVGHVGVSPLVGFGYVPDLANRVVASAADQSSNEIVTGFGFTANSGNRGSGNGSDQLNNDLISGSGFNPNSGNRGSGNGADLTSEEGGDDSVSGIKVKFLCSFGGKILPRPSDGALRYVGGQTRIISVRRDISFNELVQKMVNTYGQPVVIKYQLPDEDLDALVSVSCPDDLDNMMDEYEKLLQRSSDGSAKLRVFLFLASELDHSGLGHFGDLNDSGQMYVEAVNGIMEGYAGGIMRRDSLTSATSTQNSDFSGTEGVDSLGTGQGDVTGASSMSMLSPTANSAISHETAPRVVSMLPNSTAYADAFAFPMGSPLVKPSAPHPLSSQPEVELERSVPLTVQQQQLGYDLQRPGLVPHAQYVQAYIDPRQEVLNQADHLHHHSQMGFPGPQLLSNAGSIFAQQQFRDNATSVASHQFIPAMHMPVTPPSSHVGIRPTVVQPLIQPQQTQLERYPDECSPGTRVATRLPVDQNYNNVYQAQVSSAVAGGAYGWHQVPPSDHIFFSDRLLPHHQVIIPEKTQRLEDCHMCQKALPHAHSDPVVQDRRDSGMSPVSDVNSVYHSPRLEDGTGIQPINRVMATGGVGEGIVEQGGGARPRVFGLGDHQPGTPQSEAIVFPHRLDVQHEKERNLHRMDNDDYQRIPATHGVLGLVGDVQSPYGVLMGLVPPSSQEDAAMGLVPQSSQVDALQPQVLPTQCQVRPEPLLKRHLNIEGPNVGGMHVKTLDLLVDEGLKEYSAKLPGISKGDSVDFGISYDHLRPIDGMMETLQICPPQIYVNNEQKKSPVDKPRKEEILDNTPQKIVGREVLVDNSCGSPLVLDTNYIKPTEKPVSSTTEVPYVHNSRPMESYEVVASSAFGNPGYPQANIGGHHLDPAEFGYRSAAYSTVEPAYATDKVPPVVDRKDDASWSQPKVIVSNAETFPQKSGTCSMSPSSQAGVPDSSNSLFSNQDPWNLRHDSHFPPPRPNKIQIRKETLAARDSGESNVEKQSEVGIHNLLGNSNEDFKSEHAWSTKGSAEELIKQELQAVAEGVAASVFQSSTLSNSDLPAQVDDSVNEVEQEREDSNTSVGKQNLAKFEEIKTKLPERANFGFPVADGIGRLQIINNSDLEELRELGSGTFGTVYHGKWRGTDVAIKRINNRCFAGKPSEQERMVDDFWNEAIKLADLHHPNVVAFYGVVLDGPGGSVATVTEYMVNGSLRTALQKNERNLDKRKRLLIAMDVAFGMEYLHGKNIVHFDLKSDNLLVNLRDPHRPICKVGDLGLSKVKCQTLISGGVRGTLPWMAPELLNGSSSLVSEKVDVFSFGIVLWELLTGEEPYADLHYGAIIGGIVSNTLRPLVPESCDPEWRSLMERCWSSEPAERPSFTEIANELRSMSAKIPSKGQNPSTQPQVQK